MVPAVVATMLGTVMMRRDHSRCQCSNSHVQNESVRVRRSHAPRGCGDVHRSQTYRSAERVASVGAHECKWGISGRLCDWSTQGCGYSREEPRTMRLLLVGALNLATLCLRASNSALIAGVWMQDGLMDHALT